MEQPKDMVYDVRGHTRVRLLHLADVEWLDGEGLDQPEIKTWSARLSFSQVCKRGDLIYWREIRCGARFE